MSFATATNWAMVITFSYITNEIMCSYIGSFLIVYCTACLLSVIFVWYLVPETKNIDLAKIQEELASSQIECTSVTVNKNKKQKGSSSLDFSSVKIDFYCP